MSRSDAATSATKDSKPATKTGKAKAETDKSDGAVATDQAVPNGDFEFVENQERNLPVSLEQAEMAERGQMLGQLGVEIEDLKQVRKDAASEAQAEINGKETHRRDLQKVVAAGAETRPVNCRKEINWGANVVRVIRVDTGEVVDTRAVEADERQASLGMESGAQGGQDGDNGDPEPLPAEAGGNDDKNEEASAG